jgi:hypothetical protein
MIESCAWEKEIAHLRFDPERRTKVCERRATLVPQADAVSAANGTFETFRDVRSVIAIGGKADMTRTVHFGSFWTQSRRWMLGRILGLDGRESYRELRLEPLCCPHRLS